MSVARLIPKDGDEDGTEMEDFTLTVTTASNGWIVKYEDEEGETVEVYGAKNPEDLVQGIRDALGV